MEFDKFISTTVAQQFPQFYQAEGPQFIAFVRAYYEWMEQEGYVTNASRSLLEYKDIDTTIDRFVDSFKTEYLANFPAITAADKKTLVKHIKDFYEAKGSKQGVQLLFRLLFADDIEVYDPGTDILRASDGVWKLPKYVEVEHNPRSRDFVGTQITGSQSGATGFVESVYTKVINQRIIDVLNVSSIKGNFEYGELITNDGELLDAPKVIGSLTTIQITDGGANNKVGDVFQITASTNGKNGTAKVVAVTDGTGRVTFKLLDGGSGYTTDSSQVRISNSVIFTSNRSSSNAIIDYTQFAQICQPLYSVNYTVSTPANPTANDLYHIDVTGYNGSNTVVANGYIVVANTVGNNVIINVRNGDFALATSIKTTGNAVSFTGYTGTNATACGIITGSNSTAVGVHDVTNKFYGNGAFLTSNTSTYTVTANADSISTGVGASFSIGSLFDTEVVTLFTDMISGNNINDVPYMSMIISGSNSNTGLLSGTGAVTTNTATRIVTGLGTNFTGEVQIGSGLYSSSNVFMGTVNAISNATSLTLTANSKVNVSTQSFYYNLGSYGFPKDPAGGFNSLISDILNVNTFTIGTISSLSAINPGVDYNANPFVAIRNDYIAAFNRRNLVIELENKTGSFGIGDNVTQTYTTPSQVLAFSSNTGAYSNGEGVTQSNGTSNSYGTVIAANSTSITVNQVRGNFVTNSIALGLVSGATANLTAVTGAQTSVIAKGTIVSLPSSSSIEIERKSFNEFFQIGSTVNSSGGGAANVSSVTQNPVSMPMGFNANVSANVSIARGIATELQIIDSGYGHQPGDVLELVNNSNPFAISGTANVLYQGKGAGYWVDNRGKLNSDKYLIDSEYYQDFSYEIQSRLSMDKYADILKKLAHVAGTKMFGKVLIGSEQTMILQPSQSVIEFSS